MNIDNGFPIPSPDDPRLLVCVPDERREPIARCLAMLGVDVRVSGGRVEADGKCVPTVLVQDYYTEGIWTESRRRRHMEVLWAAAKRLDRMKDYRAADGRSRAANVAICLGELAEKKWMELLLVEVRDLTIKRTALEWLRIAKSDVVAGQDMGVFGLAIFSIFARGWLPVQWRGTWPQGFMVAWCPSGSPQCQVPPECVPTAEQLLQGGGWGSVKPPRRAKPPPLAASPEIAVVPPATWKGLLATDHREQALAKHFAPLAETPDCRDLLKRLLQRVERIEVAAGSLTLHLHRDAGMSGRGVADVIPLVCAKPYTGSLKGLPPSLAHIMRRHNGMTLNAGASVLAEWLPYQKGQFVVEWDAWHTSDPSDPNDPFPIQPLVPVTDGSDLWLLHPTQRLANGEAPVVVLEHEMGTLGEPLPYPAGGAFLRLVLHALTGKPA